jgi:hypothetical protein
MPTIPNQPGSTYSYSQFDARGDTALYLTVAGEIFPLVAFSSNFALNEIPQASCTVGVGRDAASPNAAEYAPIHANFSWDKLQEAQVYFHPSGQEARDKDWPDAPILVFDGYIVAARRTKHLGKYQVEISLTHWLFDLASSSAVSGNSHVANPGDMTSASVFSTGANGKAAYTANLGALGSAVVSSNVMNDFWGVLKSIFSAYAQGNTRPISQAVANCNDLATKSQNARALKALKRIEGSDFSTTKATNKAYEHGAALQFDFKDLPTVVMAIGKALSTELTSSYADTSFWTKLVSQFCPTFGLAVVPMIDTALVIADTPTFKPTDNQPYKIIYAEDYVNEAAVGTIERPLAGVVVIKRPADGATGSTSARNNDIVGCYQAPVVDPDGVVLYSSVPPWLGLIPAAATLTTTKTGVTSDASIREIFNRWAKEIYIKNALRGRTQTVAGRLRFDIAPGSIVRVTSAQESVLPDEDAPARIDNLGFDTFGEVARVSVVINAEAPSASTSFLLTNVRTHSEYLGTNPKNVYNTDSPGIYTVKSVHGNGKHGSPLNSTMP